MGSGSGARSGVWCGERAGAIRPVGGWKWGGGGVRNLKGGEGNRRWWGETRPGEDFGFRNLGDRSEGIRGYFHGVRNFETLGWWEVLDFGGGVPFFKLALAAWRRGARGVVIRFSPARSGLVERERGARGSAGFPGQAEPVLFVGDGLMGFDQILFLLRSDK
jgi:hypothetical protein